MIEKIKLTNFQSHLDTEVDLVPGINVLIGSSDNGKSAILRGLYWNWRNRPLGDGFIKDGEEFSEVTVNYKNRKSAFDVLRRRGKSENLYKISTLEDSFIAGTNVPKEIEEAINFSDINFQSQFSPYFLVFDSPGSIATYIRSVTGLNEIDKVVKSLTTKKNNTESEIKKLNTDLKLLEEKLEKLNKVPVLEIERNIQKAKNLSESLIVLKREKQKIESLIFQIKECEKSIICIPEETLPMLFSEIESLSEEYKNVCLQNNQLKECIQTYQSLKKSELKVSLEVKDFGIELAEEYLQNKNQLLNLNENIQTWKSLSSKKEIISVPEFDNLVTSYLLNLQQIQEINEYIKSIQDCKKDLKDSENSLSILLTEEQELLKQVEVCPYCDSELTERTREVLVKKVV